MSWIGSPGRISPRQALANGYDFGIGEMPLDVPQSVGTTIAAALDAALVDRLSGGGR
jgi:hypothetical protein